MFEVRYSEKAKKVLFNLKGGNRKYAALILDKIDFCLGEHLFDYVAQCDKKILKGSKEGVCRLHIQRKYTAIYTIEGESPHRYAQIHKIMGFEEAHQKYDQLL